MRVNEDTDPDSDYITGTLPDSDDTYCFFNIDHFNIPSNATNISLSVYFRAKDNPSTGTNAIGAGIRLNTSSEYHGTTNNPPLATTFTEYHYTWSTNPAGGAWTPDQINGASVENQLYEIGVYATDLSPDIDVSSIWAVVTYNYPITSNWNTPQAVTVTGVDDTISDGNVAYSIVTAPATSSDSNYNNLNASDASVTNNDNDKITPVIIWSDPAPILSGTALSGTQLNATVVDDIPGDFTYDPDAGAVLSIGVHELKATFTPDNPAQYNTAEKTVNILVLPIASGGTSHPWYLWDSPQELVKDTADNGGSIGINGGGSSVILMSNEGAQGKGGVTFEAGEWYVYLNAPGLTSPDCEVTIGSEGDDDMFSGSIPVPCTYSNGILRAEIDGAGGTVPETQKLVLTITNNGTPITITTDAASFLCTPPNAPNFPVPELAAGLLLALGLGGIGGFIVIKRKKALKTN